MSKLSSGSGALFLVRHGESLLSGTYCGSLNPPLTRRGHIQGKSAARRLSRFPIDICYSSPLLRAQQTAAIIKGRRAVPLKTHPSLKELRFGAWEGLTFQDIARKWPSLAQRWAEDPMNVRIPHAETFASLRRRARRFLGFIRDRFSKRNVVVVAHGGSLSAIVLELLNLPDQEFPKHIQPLGSIRMIQGQKVKTLC